MSTKEPSPREFVLAFREQWFAAMSGGVSVPFAVVAAFVDSKFGQAILIAMAFVAVWFAAYRVWKTERERALDAEAKRLTRAKVDAIKEALARFLEEGDAIRRQCAKEDQPPPTKKGQEWLDRLVKYITATDGLGASYVARLHSSAGLPAGMTTIQSQPHSNLHSNIRFRLARLHEFLSEIRPEQ
jgi:hypothetical protein